MSDKQCTKTSWITKYLKFKLFVLVDHDIKLNLFNIYANITLFATQIQQIPKEVISLDINNLIKPYP